MIPPLTPVIPPDDEIPVVEPLEPKDESPKGRPFVWKRNPSTLWVRGVLIGVAVAFSVILGLSLWLNPYDENGQPRSMATHTQLGLPPCNFVLLTGKPCPSCGMTTSFALLAHGDVINSTKANWVGTLLAAYWLVLIPWAIYSAIKGRPQWVRSGEFLITISVVGFLILAVGRWLFVILR